MRLLKTHRGQTVNVHLEAVTLRGVVVDVKPDSVSMRDVRVMTENGTADLPGPVVVSAASIIWAAVIV